MTKSFFTFYNKKIAYSLQGQGNFIVLLHGFTETMDIWNEFSAKLSSEFSVLCIDLPGHGESESVAEEHTMELFADVVNACLKNFSIKECVMIGHSMGGYAALAYTEKYGENLKGLGLFHSSALSDTPEQQENRKRAIEIIKNNHTGFITQFIPDLFAKSNREKFKEEIGLLIERAKKMTSESIIAAQLGMMKRPDRKNVLESFSNPVLFIAGKNDSRIAFDKVVEHIGLPEICYALVLKECGHMGYLENKKETLSAITNFSRNCFA